MSLLQRYINNIQTNRLFDKNDVLLLAVSGGLDSVVLCELCRRAGQPFAMAHCNFKLRGGDSDRDEAFVQQLAAHYKVPFYMVHFDTVAEAAQRKQSIETTARHLRYDWLEGLRLQCGFAWVATAHHADDNAETAMMHFFRGTGIRGLRGMLPKQANVVRPLLFARRTELETFLTENGLAHVTDQTNFEDDYTRNYFRNQLIPGLQKVFPQAVDNVLHNIERMTGVETVYHLAIEQYKKKLLEPKGNEVHIPVLKLQRTPAMATVLFEIITAYGFTAHQTEDVLALLHSQSGKYVASATHRILRNRQWLIIAPLQTTEAQHILIEAPDREVVFAGGALQFSTVDAAQQPLSTDAHIAQLDAAAIQFPLLLRPWKQGDYFYPLGMAKKKKLSRFFGDLKLSMVEKEKVWVLEMDKKIVWVVGRRVDDRVKVTGKTKQMLLIKLIG
jgi:tRNA(Ile)-lysidine synthase